MPVVHNAFFRFQAPVRPLLAALTAGFSLVAGGCYSEGGLGWSEDQFVYVSHEYQPWSVTLKDTRSNQDIWWIDVPVGQQLVIHFLPGEKTQAGFTPDVMEWALMETGTEFGSLSNRLSVPDKNSRRLDAHLRPTPELPGNMRPGESRPAPAVSTVSEPMTPPSGR